ncbi:MAG: hypothetical protein QF654_03705 [Alphaproteobacteria bacterium]|jgi:hypothetical protein|nr:hypothetical protein [Alphaproteobacteria bacterium]
MRNAAAIFLMAGLLASGLAACDEEPSGLFVTEAGGAPARGGQDADAVVRIRTITINKGLYDRLIAPMATADDTTDIELNLFADVVVTARLARRSFDKADGTLILGGEALGFEHSLVSLLIDDSGLNGNIHLDDRVFQIRAMGGGRHVIEEVDTSRIPKEHPK